MRQQDTNEYETPLHRRTPTGTRNTYGPYETLKRGDDWSARMVSNHGYWESGKTEAEALGRLYIRMWREQQNDRERQYKLDAATFAWTLAFRRWQADDTQPFPILRPFADGLSPEDAVRLMDYALDAIIDGLPEPMSAAEEPETLELSPAGERALAAIQAQDEREGGDA